MNQPDSFQKKKNCPKNIKKLCALCVLVVQIRTPPDTLTACLKPTRRYSAPMTRAVAHILDEAKQLSTAERAELADRLVESLARDIPPDIAAAQVAEVRRRIAQAESGEVALILGDEALARVRQLVASARRAS